MQASFHVHCWCIFTLLQHFSKFDKNNLLQKKIGSVACVKSFLFLNQRDIDYLSLHLVQLDAPSFNKSAGQLKIVI